MGNSANFLRTVTALKEFTAFIFRKWWIIGGIAMLAGILGVVMAWMQRPKYESHLTFALEEGEGGLGGALSLAAEFGLNIGSTSNLFQGDNILTLLRSRRIVERVLLSVDTVNGRAITMADYLVFVSRDSTKKTKKVLSEKEKRLSSVSFPVGQPRSSFSYLQDSVLLNMYKDFVEGDKLKVGKPDKKLNLYEVSIVSPDERFTKVFTDRIVKEAIDFYTELKSSKAKQTLDVLEARVEQTKGNIYGAITSRAGLQDANVNPAFQQAQAQIQKKQVDVTAYGGAYGELYKNLELARFQYLKAIPLLQIIDEANYPMKRIKNGKLKMGIIFSLASVFITLLFFTIRYVFKKALDTGDSLVFKT